MNKTESVLPGKNHAEKNVEKSSKESEGIFSEKGRSKSHEETSGCQNTS